MIYEYNLGEGTTVLRPLTEADCNETYLGWLNDCEVNRFLETRWEEQSIDKIVAYVKDIHLSDHSYIFAIEHLEKQQNIHIGNIKIGPINYRYKYADVSYFIGEKSFWGKGIATEAIKTISRFGFDNLSLNRIQAGVVGGNIGSIKALEKAGFKYEGCLREKLFTEEYVNDHLLYGLLKRDISTG